VKLAEELRERTLELLMRHKDVYEFYDPETGEPGAPAAPAFGWSAALFISCLRIVGISRVESPWSH